MRYIHSQESLTIPEGGTAIENFVAEAELELCCLANMSLLVTVKVSIKTRIVTVEGPRGTTNLL